MGLDPRGIAAALLARLDYPMARRSRMREAMPMARLQAEHTRGATLLPDRLALLDLMPKAGEIAEVGVADGDFSAEILARCAPRRLHLVDAWEGHRFSPGLARVEGRFAAEIEAGRVQIDQGLSTEVLETFEDASLDWAYIDTDHTYRTTAAELQACARVVRAGGRILGHDFCTGNVVAPVVYGVVNAVNEFCVQQGWAYEYLTLESHGHFSFCLRRPGS